MRLLHPVTLKNQLKGGSAETHAMRLYLMMDLAEGWQCVST